MRATSSQIYVIASEAGRVKIGISTDPQRRLETLQSGSPIKLSLVHTVEPTPFPAQKVEAAAHDLLKAVRAHGEWFDADAGAAIAAIETAILSLSRPPVVDEPRSDPFEVPCTIDGYRDALKKLGFTPSGQDTAAALGLSLRQCQRIAAGDSSVPEPVAKLLAMYVQHGLPARRD